MPVTRRRIAHAALLASASFLSMTLASEAQAQCVPTPTQPLNNITTDSTIVSCTGSVNGPVITVNADGVNVDTNGPGTNVSGANITVTGNSNAVQVRNGAILNGSQIALNGTGNTMLYGSGAVSNGSIVNISGANSQLLFLSGSQVTQNPGQTTISALAGQQNSIVIFAGGGLFTTGGNGQYLITGGTGNQNVVIDGFFVAPSDGLAIALGDGDDSIAIGGAANISTQASGIALFNGGAGTDTFSINDDGMWIHDTVGFEVININPNTAITLTGSNADAVQFNVQGGSVTVTSGAALGVANSTVDIGQFGELTLAYTASASFNNTLTGSGRLNVDSSGNTITFGGDGTGYSGAVVISGGTTAALGQAGAVGTGGIINNGTISWSDFDLANNIAGIGNLIYTGVGTGDLSGANSFSGGIDIRSGSLRVTTAGALGTGAVTSTTGGVILQFDNGAYQALANDLTGGLVLAKTSGGVLELTGTNTYTGGTLIDTGAIRVDSFARLGTGQVIANAGGSLILNYNGSGQLLQTTTFLTGAGSFIKEGNGDVVMDLVSTYTGGTIIREGRLGLNDGLALGTGAIQIDAGAELGVGGIILNNDLTGGGLVRKTASNTVELNGNNIGFVGTILVEDGDMLVTNGNALGSGTLQINSGTAVYINATADSVMAASLTGAGNFEKAGAGRITLTGNGSQFGGNIAIQNGTLQIAGDQNIGTSPGGVFINTLGTLQLDTAGSTNLATVVYGSGKVVKTGTGTVFMTGANTYSGGTDIQQGAIRVTDVGVLGTGAITVQAGAALDLSIAGAQTLSQNVTGAGILRKSDSGDLTLLSNGLTGGVDIVGGRVIVNSAAAIGGGPVTTAAGTRLVFDNAATEVSNTPISGAGGLTKTGTGLLVMNNANSFTGGTLISAGRLGLNDGMGLGTGTITIQQGAILGIGGVNVANAIVGAGQVIKTANNTATLTGNNAYSGGTDIQQGAVRVTNPASLGTGGVQMASGTQLIVDYSGANNVALNNVLSGAGALVKDGSGTVVMNAQGNTYSGGTTINAGRLGLNFGDALGTGAVTIASGAELAIGDIQLANNVSGAGRIIKTSAGTSSLTGTNTHSGGIAIQAGVLAVSGNGALGTGTVSIGSGASLDYTNAAAATFSNGLSGAGTFTKLGAGQLTFASNFTIGALALQAGRTRINTVATTNATVAAGATLDGTGRIIGNLVNNGTVAPGNSIGTLTVQGNYTHNATGVLEVEFDANGNIDLLDVTGNAVLNGGTIRFVGIGGAEGQGGTFLRTGGSVTGTFSTIETVGAQLPLAVFYTANTGQMAPSVVTARPSTFNAQALAAADTAFAFIDTLGVVDARHGRGNRVWLSGFGAWGSRSASGTTLAYDHETRGISGGINLDMGGNFTLGGALGWAKGDIELGSNGGGGDQTHTLGSLNLRYGTDDITLGVGMVLGNVDQATLRNVSFNGFSGSVSGETESDIVAFFAEAGVPLGETGGWNFAVNARGSVVRQEQDGYTESGTSPLRLRLGNIATESVEGVGRLTATTRLWDGNVGAEENASGLDLRVDLGGRYLALQGDRPIPVTFAVSNAGIVLQGDTRDTAQAIGGLALDYTTSSGAIFSLGYRGEIGKTDRHAVQAGISIAF
ncbi:autotransporter-associated beta strand repeat-containing protein [Erythrobacter sp. BLCC-B19]|uniref:autotransporter-associated beta strand repeat-containing protein n=1 Tax=Erythrobacter sp. BLCC-B19 TaxID=3025315 RepID=UPI00235F5C1D|nr:autotransporter-associated beta strand repeat-containing protein [Erythrobacter sp. BLCC-B19]WDA39802.1 autotransporter-associated beta strand repeat-containing protein [Erythrobacter sp. BLCC-B19]